MRSAAAQAEREAELDAALEAMLRRVPYHRLLGVRFDRLGDELTARLPYGEHLIGNPMAPAVHGGATASFLEIAGQMQLAWERFAQVMDRGGEAADAVRDGRLPALPKTIDITVDYLRRGRPREMFARTRVQKAGRRVAHLHVEAWQDQYARPIATLRGNFLMPEGG